MMRGVALWERRLLFGSAMVTLMGLGFIAAVSRNVFIIATVVVGLVLAPMVIASFIRRYGRIVR